MRKLGTRAMALGMAAIMAISASFLFSPVRQVSASEYCPTDPLSSLTPYNTNFNDPDPVNVGVKFKVRSAPQVLGVKFYKGVDNTGTHVAHLRTAGGSTDLASATFTGETSSGWQTVYFSSPVDVNSIAEYKVWVSMPNGHYAADGGAASGPNHFDKGLGIAYESAGRAAYIMSGDSGLYEYTSDDTVAPSNDTVVNFWVTPIIGDEVAPTDIEDFNIGNATGGPEATWTADAYDDNSATLSGAPAARTELIRDDGTTSVVVNGGGNFVAGLKDVTALPGTNYTYTYRAYDHCGNASTGATDTLTTSSQSLTNLFGSTAPASVDSGNTDNTIVGMHWQTSTAGKVWGARFYRDAGTLPSGLVGNQFVVTLWDNNGDVLASTTVPGQNRQTGWIDVQFDAPVDVDANHDYVIGYFMPNGQLSYTTYAHTSAVTNGTLTAQADTSGTPNGVYAQSSGSLGATTFPTNRAGSSTWYGVDVNFYIP